MPASQRSVLLQSSDFPNIEGNDGETGENMTKKLLLADDEEGILALVSSTLAGDERYEVLMARNGDEALYLARQEKPDLLFLDIRMPRKDGYEVCRALKEDPDTAHIKVVMLTALPREANWERAMEAGADGYITKPFSPTMLLKKAEEVLDPD